MDWAIGLVGVAIGQSGVDEELETEVYDCTALVFDLGQW